MNRIVPIFLIVLAAALIAAGTIHRAGTAAATTPERAVQSLLERVEYKDLQGAYSFVAQQSNTDFDSFVRDLRGSNGSLRTISTLQKFETKVLRQSDIDADVRATIEWATAVGAVYDTRDVKVIREDSGWKALWPEPKQPKVPPQVIPVNYLRWDIVTRGADDDWGAQNAEAPHVRIVSMNAIERDGATIVLGEIVNEDTVPGFVSVGGTLLDKNGAVIGQETSFDKISHTLLPKEISPFRIDYPGVKLSRVKSVRMQPNSMLVPAAADPVIGVLHQRLEHDARGHSVLKGELINQSGQTVNIPHVLATYYDSSGRVIWVSDGYVNEALVPQTPVAFSVGLRDDLAATVHTYRVTVNQYSLNRQQ